MLFCVWPCPPFDIAVLSHFSAAVLLWRTKYTSNFVLSVCLLAQLHEYCSTGQCEKKMSWIKTNVWHPVSSQWQFLRSLLIAHIVFKTNIVLSRIGTWTTFSMALSKKINSLGKRIFYFSECTMGSNAYQTRIPTRLPNLAKIGRTIAKVIIIVIEIYM